MLQELRAAGRALDVYELARRVGLHANTVRSHLAVLADAGLVSSHAKRQARVGRPRTAWEASATQSSPAQADGYRQLVQILASYLAESAGDPGRQATNAGEAWGRYLARGGSIARGGSTSERASDPEGLSELVEALDQLGFSPQADLDETAPRLLLRRCPFRDVAAAHPEVVCSIHLGLMNGLLDELRAPLQATRLRPFISPSLCIAELTRPTRRPAHARGEVVLHRRDIVSG